MKQLNDFLKENNIKPLRYIRKGKIYIVEENNLSSRSFDYIPKIIEKDNNYMLVEYIDDIEIPREQKIIDLIGLVSLLHSKTTYYKETTKDDFKQIYEDIKSNIDYLKIYYDDIMRLIESKVYFSPSEYLLARNISIIYKSLYFCENKIEDWYKLTSNNSKQRYVLLHNNLDLSHFIENDRSYLINWDKSKKDLPIFDLYKLYKNHHIDFEFSEILDEYEKNYPLKEEEKLLFFILISLPEELKLNKCEYDNCIIISNEIDRLFKSEKLFSLYQTDNNNYTNGND